MYAVRRTPWRSIGAVIMHIMCQDKTQALGCVGVHYCPWRSELSAWAVCTYMYMYSGGDYEDLQAELEVRKYIYDRCMNDPNPYNVHTRTTLLLSL